MTVSLCQLDRYIIRSLARPVAAILAALTLVMLLERGLRLLQEMTALGLHGRFFLPLMARLLPYYLAQAIPAALVGALILVLGRMANNREWEAMAAAGVKPSRIARPMVLIAAILAALTLFVSGWLEPVGRYGYRTLHALALNESRIRALQPMAIYAPGKDVMLSADRVDGEGLHRIFLWLANPDGSENVATARLGRIEAREGPSALVFHLADGLLLNAEQRQLRFGVIAINQPLSLAETHWKRGRDARELTLSELMMQGDERLDATMRARRDAEIFGRLARSLAMVVLPWIVMPLILAFRTERRWPAVTLIVAMVVAYYHGVNFTRNLSGGGGFDLRIAYALAVALPIGTAALLWRLGGKPDAYAPLQWLGKLKPIRPRPAQGSLSVRWPHVLAGYLSLRLLAVTMALLAVLVLLFQLVDLLERGAALIHLGAGPAGFVTYAWLKLPATILQATPIAMLGGALLAFARLRTASELVAIHACGVSAFGILRRSLVVPLLLGVAMVGIAETWTPRSELAFSAWWKGMENRQPAPAPSPAPVIDERRWFRFGHELVHAAMADASGRRLAALHIYRRDAEGRLEARLGARNAVWTGSGWRLDGAEIWRPGHQGEPPMPLARAEWSTDLSPVAVRRFFAAPVPLSGRDAWRALRAHAPVDQAQALYQTRILMSLCMALSPLVMLILAVAVIVRPRRDVKLATGLFQACIAGLSFLVVNGYCQVMGQAGEMSPWLAVLVAPVLFTVIGFQLLLRSERNE